MIAVLPTRMMEEEGKISFFFFFQAEDGIRDLTVTGVQTCALPISGGSPARPLLFGLQRDEAASGPAGRWNPAPAPPVLLPGVRKGGSAAGAGDREGRSRHHPVRRRLAGGGGERRGPHSPPPPRPTAAP